MGWPPLPAPALLGKSARWLSAQTITFQNIITGALQIGQEISSATAGWIFRGNGESELKGLWVDGEKQVSIEDRHMGFSNLVGLGGLNGDASQIQPATGVLTVTRSYHHVDSEDSSGDDTVNTINSEYGNLRGDILIIRSVTGARDITFTEVDNIQIAGSPTTYKLETSSDLVMFVFNGTNWIIFVTHGGGFT